MPGGNVTEGGIEGGHFGGLAGDEDGGRLVTEGRLPAAARSGAREGLGGRPQRRGAAAP